jgi:hypothetical protein
MSTGGPGISLEGENDVGGPTGDQPGLLKDVVPSCSDPHDDLVMPYLPWPSWKVLLDSPAAQEKNVLNALKAVIAWRAAGRLRRAYNFKLWDGEDSSHGKALPTPIEGGARQYRVEDEEIRDRINSLEDGAFKLMTESLDLTRQMLQASEQPLLKDSRLAVLREASKQNDPAKRTEQVKSYQLSATGPARLLQSHLNKNQRETFEMIDASAAWGLYLARQFRDHFQKLTENDVVELKPGWWKLPIPGRGAGCVGHATRDLLWNQLNDEEMLPSARYLWHGAKELDGEPRPTTFIAGAGTSLRGALQLVKRVGCALDSELPSQGLELFQGSLKEFYDKVSRRRVAGVVNLGLDMKLWASWLRLRRPLVCSIQTNSEFQNLRGIQGEVNFDPDDGRNFNHAVVIAGWRVSPSTFSTKGPVYNLVAGAMKADTKDRPGEHHFTLDYLVRDSSTPGWGADGYAWVPHRQMLLMAYEAYGVLLSKAELDNPGPVPAQRSWMADDSPDTAS